jgi:hypothetical protein
MPDGDGIHLVNGPDWRRKCIATDTWAATTIYQVRLPNHQLKSISFDSDHVCLMVEYTYFCAFEQIGFSQIIKINDLVMCFPRGQ